MLFPTLPEPLARGSLDLVYAAYGLDLPAWSDYEGLDVRGRAVLVRSRVPPDLPDSIRDMASGQAGVGLRINAAVQRGASAVVLVLEDSLRDLYDLLVAGVLTTTLPRPPQADTS